MIIVDTNVVSEPFRPNPSANVIHWLDRQPASILFLTTVSLAELYRGIAILPDGKRKQGLKEDTDRFLHDFFGSRILAFDIDAALAYAEMTAMTRASGLAMSFADAQIASIALAHGFSVATRDVAAFTAAGVKVINPWTQR